MNEQKPEGRDVGLSAGLERKVSALLDAAFAELQHDTGPGDVEWRHQRRVLRDKFFFILRSNPT